MSENQLSRLLYSLWDIQQSLSALTFLLEECDFDAKYSRIEIRRLRCFETTAVIAFARPFEVGRGRTALSLRSIGVTLDAEEKALMQRLIALRGKVVAHSDEEQMHFRVSTLQPLDDSSLRAPELQFQESLHLDRDEVDRFELLLGKLRSAIGSALFQIAQTTPERLEKYVQPQEQTR